MRSRDGFYLVKKLDARPATVAPFEQVRATIERRLLLAKRQEAEGDFQSQSRQAAGVSTNAALLAVTDYPKPNPGKMASARLPGFPSSP